MSDRRYSGARTQHSCHRARRACRTAGGTWQRCCLTACRASTSSSQRCWRPMRSASVRRGDVAILFDPDIGPLTAMLHAVGLPSLDWTVDRHRELIMCAVVDLAHHRSPSSSSTRRGLRFEQVYEAGTIDGTSAAGVPPSHLPLLRPAVLFRPSSRSAFLQVWLVTQGGPARSTSGRGLFIAKPSVCAFAAAATNGSWWCFARAGRGLYLLRRG